MKPTLGNLIFVSKIFIIGILFLVSVLTSIPAFTRESAKTKHRHHEAHVHGAATLNIAFDNLQGKIEFKAAAEGVVGFEFEAISKKDKEKLADVITFFENNISRMIAFESSLGCKFSKEKIEMMMEKQESEVESPASINSKKDKTHVHSHGGHSDFIANFVVTCEKSPLKSKLKIDFTEIKGLNDIDAIVIIDNLQKSFEVKKKTEVIELM